MDAADTTSRKKADTSHVGAQSSASHRRCTHFLCGKRNPQVAATDLLDVWGNRHLGELVLRESDHNTTIEEANRRRDCSLHTNFFFHSLRCFQVCRKRESVRNNC